MDNKTKPEWNKVECDGYLFNGKFYKDIQMLYGRTMDDTNLPTPVYFEKPPTPSVKSAEERGKEYVKKHFPHWVETDVEYFVCINSYAASQYLHKEQGEKKLDESFVKMLLAQLEWGAITFERFVKLLNEKIN